MNVPLFDLDSGNEKRGGSRRRKPSRIAEVCLSRMKQAETADGSIHDRRQSESSRLHAFLNQ